MYNSKVTCAYVQLFFFILCISFFTSCTPSHKRPRLELPEHSTAVITEKRKSVIIYPGSFSKAAGAFSYLHHEFGGVEAILVSLEEIENSGLPTGNIRVPFKGWETERPQRVHIRGYDFQLAKKIIAYLRNLEKREDILSVLLLGDAALIPPSYYFHLPYLKKINVDDKPYNEWIASDLLYASPDFDLVHEWAVGRIAVDTPDQALMVAEKQYRWAFENRKEVGKPFIYFAGNIRKDVVYSGELLYLLLEQEGIVDAKTKHYFESDNRFTIKHLRNSFVQDEARIHYIFTHGIGDGFEINGDHLYSEEIADMPYKNGLPLIISPSCMDGGFDYDLIDAPHDRDGYSIGEAILRSEGAGIGYLGSSRISLGKFYYRMRNGELDPTGVHYRYMPGLLMDFLNAYHEGTHRIGDAYVEAHERYRKRFGLLTPQDLATFVELNLLADPVMILPEPPGWKTKRKFEHLKIQSKHGFKRKMVFVPLDKPLRYALNKKSQHDAATVTVVDVLKGRVLLRKRVTREKDMVLTATYKSTFLMRLDFDDGTVSWQYFQSGM